MLIKDQEGVYTWHPAFEKLADEFGEVEAFRRKSTFVFYRLPGQAQECRFWKPICLRLKNGSIIK